MRVSLPRFAAQNGQRGNFRIRLETLARLIGAAIVVNDDLIFPRIGLKDLADAPEQNPDGGPFVVRRNTDVKQAASMTWLSGRTPQDRRGRVLLATGQQLVVHSLCLLGHCGGAEHPGARPGGAAERSTRLL